LILEILVFAGIAVALSTAGLVAWRWLRGPARHPSRFLLRLGILAVASALLVTWSAWKLSNARTVQLFGGIVPRVETNEPVVALTFDDGPTAEHTDEVLAILREHNVKATFFLIGRKMEGSPAETRRIVAEGHEVGNHSLTHPRMILKPLSFVRGEIEATDALIRAAGYEGPIHFRSPYGKKLLVLPFYLWRSSRLNIFWDVAPEGDRAIRADPARIVEYVVAKTRPGSIILLHVMPRSRRTSREALPGILQGLKDRGYRFVTVSELLATPYGH
jgi:peptidoglycan/xylan/chitin deacetylase (PgdA/CDA1 family)